MILIAPNQPGFPDLTELLEAPPCRSRAGSICYPRWRARRGTRTWNYGAIMCDRFRGIRGDGRLTVSHAHGSAKTLYKTFVCFKMGVFVKSQAHIDLTTCTLLYVLSFPLHRLDSGSLPSTLKSMSRPLPCSFPTERAIVR